MQHVVAHLVLMQATLFVNGMTISARPLGGKTLLLLFPNVCCERLVATTPSPRPLANNTRTFRAFSC